MLRRMTALILALLLAATAVPAALAASEACSAHTPLFGADSDKLNNIRLAAQAIDGTTVAAGERFSFNSAVGPREKRRGYRTAPNGRGVQVTGGGVAQVATTLYMALLQMGAAVDIDPVKTYGARFTDDYVQDPSLAVVTDYDAGIDLSFTSLTGDLSIDMWMDENDLWCVVTPGKSGGLSAPGKGGSSLFSLSGDESADFEDSPSFFEPISGDEDRFEAVDEDRFETSDDDRFETSDDDRFETSDDDCFETSDDDRFETVDEDGYPPRDGGFMVSVDDRADNPSLRPQGSSIIHCGGDPDVVHNVTLAANSLNDTMLNAGDVFSFNDVVGPRTNKYGYRRAVNGRGAKVTGGGVAQVASALWLAIENMRDIQIVEMSTYGSRYNQRYVADPADAILTDYASDRDFRFRYTGKTRLTIYAYVEEGRLYCDVIED